MKRPDHIECPYCGYEDLENQKYIDHIEKQLQKANIINLSQAEQADYYQDVTVNNMTRVIGEQKETIDLFRNQLKQADEFKEFITAQLEKGGLMFLIQRDKDAYLKLIKQ